MTLLSQCLLPMQHSPDELSRAFAVISNPLPKGKIIDLCFMALPPLSIPMEPGCKFSADFTLHLGSMGWRSARAVVLCLLFSSCQPLFILLSDSRFFSPSSASTKPVQGKVVVQYPSPDLTLRKSELEGVVHPVEEEKSVIEADHRSSHIRQTPHLLPLCAGHSKACSTVTRHGAFPECETLPASLRTSSSPQSPFIKVTSILHCSMELVP